MQTKSFGISRRAFIGKVSFAVGGVVVTGLMPASILQAAPSMGCGSFDPCGDWPMNGHVDDICNSYPPYSHRVDTVNYSCVTAQIDSADWHWIS